MKTEYEKCLAGEPFNGGRDLEIAEMTLQTRRLLAIQALRQMVSSGHIHAEQGKQGDGAFQGTAAGDSRHIPEDADGDSAYIGGGRLCHPHRIS